jgi:hypothetical protein
MCGPAPVRPTAPLKLDSLSHAVKAPPFAPHEHGNR